MNADKVIAALTWIRSLDSESEERRIVDILLRDLTRLGIKPSKALTMVHAMLTAEDK